jgi:hypothetical protein
MRIRNGTLELDEELTSMSLTINLEVNNNN